MSFKILLTKEGIDIFDATEPDDYIFSSDYDTLKYETVGDIRVSYNLNDYYHVEPGGFPFPTTYYHRHIGTVAHGLGYTPFFSGYLLDVIAAGETIQSPFWFGDFVFFAYIAVYADATNLYFEVQFNTDVNTGTGFVDFRYRIFKNDLGL